MWRMLCLKLAGGKEHPQRTRGGGWATGPSLALQGKRPGHNLKRTAYTCVWSILVCLHSHLKLWCFFWCSFPYPDDWLMCPFIWLMLFHLPRVLCLDFEENSVGKYIYMYILSSGMIRFDNENADVGYHLSYHKQTKH